MPIRPALVASFIAAGVVFAGTTGARAEDPADLQPCAQQYQAAKADNKLTQAWQDFYPDCKARLAAAPAAESKPAEAPVEKAEAPKTEAPAAPAAEPAPAAATPAEPVKAEKAAASAPSKSAVKKKPAKKAPK